MSEVEEEISTRDALEAAFDEIEETETEGEVSETELAEESETEAEVSGAEVEEPADESEDSDEGAEDSAAEVPDDDSGTDSEGVPDTAETAKPPASWTPAAREVWNDVPESARREIEKREREINVKLQETAEERKGYQSFQEAIAPHQQLIAMEANGDAVTVTRNLMNFATQMRFGQDQDKAQILGQLINYYNVDIGMLDQAITSSAPAAGQVGPSSRPPPSVADPRLEEMWQDRQRQQQTAQSEVANTVSQFMADPKNEFAQDVREDMADLMDLASRRGQQLTLEQAYERAIAVRPDIQQVLQGRTAVPAADGDSIRRKKRAAKQISGSPASGSSDSGPKTLEETLSQAWDEVTRG